jgi:hypothetical protein
MTQAEAKKLVEEIAGVLSSKYGGEVRPVVGDILMVDLGEFAFHVGPMNSKTPGECDGVLLGIN